MENIHYETLITTVNLILKEKHSHEDKHSENVSKICVKMAQLMSRFTPHEIDMLKWGCLLHDSGKIFIEDDLINAPRPLTLAENKIMETHTVMGRDFLTNMGCDPIIISIAHYHHINEDGSGYPRSKSDGSIFPGMVRVADTYDAMTSNRVYKFPASSEEAIQVLEAESGTIFNAEAVFFLKLAIAEIEQEKESDEYR